MSQFSSRVLFFSQLSVKLVHQQLPLLRLQQNVFLRLLAHLEPNEQRQLLGCKVHHLHDDYRVSEEKGRSREDLTRLSYFLGVP